MMISPEEQAHFLRAVNLPMFFFMLKIIYIYGK
jgi:hypothetical protein